MRVCFLLPTVAHGRHPKRIRAMEREGVQARVLAFERPGQENLGLLKQVEVLGRLQQGAYLSRAQPYLAALPRVRAALRDCDVVHAFGVDLGGLAAMAGAGAAGGPKLVVEVADIREVLLGTSLKAGLARWVERLVLSRAKTLVTTAPDFATEYFQSIQGVEPEKILVIENKLAPTEIPEPRALSLREGLIRIGYFGLLRCRDSFEVLDRVARESEGRVEVHLRGLTFGLPDFEERLAANPQLHHGGSFLSPSDLPEMYGGIDLSWVAHRHGRSNTDWSRLNRFYESGAFHRPMIGQVGTPDGRAIETGGFGPLIDIGDHDAAVAGLLSLGAAEVEGWAAAVALAPRSTFVFTDEHQRLLAGLAG